MRRLWGMTAAGSLLVGGRAGRRLRHRDAGREQPSRMAWAELKNASGESVGSALLRQEDGRVRIVVQASGLPPDATASTCTQWAGASRPRSRARAAHFNPMAKKHGLESPEGAHGGRPARRRGRCERPGGVRRRHGPADARKRPDLDLRRGRERHRDPPAGGRPANGPLRQLGRPRAVRSAGGRPDERSPAAVAARAAWPGPPAGSPASAVHAIVGRRSCRAGRAYP